MVQVEIQIDLHLSRHTNENPGILLLGFPGNRTEGLLNCSRCSFDFYSPLF